jgi:redox-sensing transcriptional repressor
MITNKNCIVRLSRYKKALQRFKALGLIKIFSEYLADAAGTTSVQVRKDFSLFGISGNKRGGYYIDALIEKLNDILGKNELQKVILVGSGHMGAALMKYKGFEKEGIKIVAAFDIDPAKINKSGQIPVFPLEELKSYIEKNSIKIGIIGVPDMAAQDVADQMIVAGIKGILNFAPIRLKIPDNRIINNVNLELELENVIYFVNMLEKANAKNLPVAE